MDTVGAQADTKGAPSDNSNILALGFFGRSNMGDDAYNKLLPVLFPGCRIMCFDDVISIAALEGASGIIDTLVCGGGDIINPYFMENLKRIINAHASSAPGRPLRVYGLSVGIPFASGARPYLAMFDHLFVRSRHDYAVAAAEMGEANVSLVPDMAFLLPRLRALAPPSGGGTKPIERIAVCLAQPMFAGNPRAGAILGKIAGVIERLLEGAFPKASIQLLACNTSDPVANPKESDHAAIGALWWALKESVRSKCSVQQAPTVEAIQRALASADVVIGSRFHSVVFSALEGVPCVALYCQQKIQNFVTECRVEGVRMRVDGATYKPTDFDEEELFKKVINAAVAGGSMSRQRAHDPRRVEAVYATAQALIRNKRGRITDVGTMAPPDNSAASVRERCLANLTSAFGEHIAQAMLSPGRFSWGALTRQEVEEALRIICYSITDAPDAPYYWGLYAKVVASEDAGFDISESVAWMANDFRAKARPWTSVEAPSRDAVMHEYVPFKLLVDPYYQRWVVPGANQHREGWQIVVAHMRAAYAAAYSGPDVIIVDTFVDRTFHWGEAAFRASGVLPYRRPWIGFIHHTFNETHSTFNCTELMRKPSFIESLASCKGLIVLSKHLATQLRAQLPEAYAGLPVISMKHPVHFSSGAAWTPRVFMDNPDKKLVQIGSWLRRPFSIYRLKIREGGGEITVRKCALRGRAMDKYFAPDDFHESMRRMCCGDKAASASVNDMNKYVEGALSVLLEMEASVEVLEYMNNAEYDALLSGNVIFLDLEDASACNTVLECMASNTPLIVNRLPALEEVLGRGYPGFYDSLEEASAMSCDVHRVLTMHSYLALLDKSEHTMSHFLAAFCGHAHSIARL